MPTEPATNEDKFATAALVAANAMKRFVDLLERIEKLVLEEISKDKNPLSRLRTGRPS